MYEAAYCLINVGNPFLVQALWLMTTFEQLNFWMFYFMKNDHAIIVKCNRGLGGGGGGGGGGVSSAAGWWWRSDGGSGGKAPEKSSAF